MALLFMDGFDTADSAMKWGAAGSTSTTSTRFGTGRAVIPQVNNANLFFPASAQIFVGAAMKLNDYGNNRDLLSLYGDSGATLHLVLNVNTSGQLQVLRGGTPIVGTSSVWMPTGVWNYWELSATISATVGTVEVRLNGVTLLTFTGNTKNGGTATTIDRLLLGTQYNGALASDDFYLCNSSGSTNNTFLGDVRVQTLLPTAAGASTQLTPTGVANNWDNVNDAPYNSATYNSSSTSGQRDTYAMGDLLAGTGTVFAVQDTIIAAKSDAGAASIKAAVKSGATVYYDAAMNLGTSQSSSSAVRETDPATSAAWTATNVNSVEFGAEIV